MKSPFDDRKFRLITVGVASALGSGQRLFHKRIVEGSQSFFQVYPRKIAGRELFVGSVSGELPAISERFSRYNSRNFQLALLACAEIKSDIEELKLKYGPERIAVVMGSSTSGIRTGEEAVREKLSKGDFPKEYDYTQQELGSVSDGLRSFYGLQNISYTVSTACSSSSKVFGTAMRLLESNTCDAVLVGGADSLCEMTLRGFTSLELTSQGLCNPFSKNRDGINIGEGAAIFILTKEAGGIQLCGVGESSDAYHMSAPEPSGKGAAEAMSQALRQSKLKPKDIGYLNLHGTGTTHNDMAESKAVSSVFKDSLPSCSSSKAVFGHTLGASGALELAVCWSVLEAGGEKLVLPKHTWDGRRDAELADLPLLDESKAVAKNGQFYCMSNSFAFGGSNCSIVVGVN